MALYQRLKRQILSQVQLVRVGLGIAIVAGLLAVWFMVLGPLASRSLGVLEVARTGLPQANGRTNILILGREGDNAVRGGGLLTDTIMLFSVDRQTPDMVLLSIPRDIWVPSMKAKINTAYFYGEQKKPEEGGLVLAKAAVNEIIDQPIHYAVVIDFKGFEKVIDLLGGVDINVEQGFVDERFPIPGLENDECNGDLEYMCRYETIEFKPGLQHMDGKTALKFVRSRQAEGDEGSDFARSRRQEKLILAIRGKLLSASVLTNFKLMQQLYIQGSEMVVTDIDASLYPALAKLAVGVAKAPLRTATLVEPDQLYHPPISVEHQSQWVLLPNDNLRSYIKDFLTSPVQN